jgi:hypothetical protein
LRATAASRPAKSAPKGREGGIRSPERDRILPEFDTDGQRIRRQRRFQRHDPVEPGEKQFGFFGIEVDLLDLDKLAVFELAGDPGPPIRGDSNEFLAFHFLAISEIVWQFALDIWPLLSEIALGFENCPADQRVETAAHFRHPALEIEGRQISAKFLDQQLPKIGLDLVVAWLSRKVAQKVYRRRSDHQVRITVASELDNLGGRAIQSFLHNIRHRPRRDTGRD